MDGADTLLEDRSPDYSGTVEVMGVTFTAEEDGYAILEVQDTGSGEEFALVGPVAHLSAGDRADVRGRWETHARFGPQLRASGALPLDPSDRKGQISYLTS